MVNGGPDCVATKQKIIIIIKRMQRHQAQSSLPNPHAPADSGIKTTALKFKNNTVLDK